MKIKAIDLAVPIVGAAACLVMYAELPLWALFIGWAWYYALGAEPGAFKTALPSALAGGSMGVLCFLVVGHISPPLSHIPATMVALFITLLILMMILKIPAFSASLPAYNAYSCFIIGYGAQAWSLRGCCPSSTPLSGLSGLIFWGWSSDGSVSNLKGFLKRPFFQSKQGPIRCIAPPGPG
mgnify:CR=1 FL=1